MTGWYKPLMKLPQLDWNASLDWVNMASFASPSWSGSLWLLTGMTLHFLSVVSVLICQSRTAGSSSLDRSLQCSPPEYLLLLEVTALQLPPSCKCHPPGPYSHIAMAVSPSEKHRTSSPARAGPLWRTFHSSIYLSWHHRVCSPSQAEGPSRLTAETNVTSSPGCTDKPLEHRYISTFHLNLKPGH